MLRSRKNIGLHRMNCRYGCCPSAPKKTMRRLVKRREQRAWRKEYA